MNVFTYRHKCPGTTRPNTNTSLGHASSLFIQITVGPLCRRLPKRKIEAVAPCKENSHLSLLLKRNRDKYDTVHLPNWQAAHNSLPKRAASLGSSEGSSPQPCCSRSAWGSQANATRGIDKVTPLHLRCQRHERHRHPRAAARLRQMNLNLPRSPWPPSPLRWKLPR